MNDGPELKPKEGTWFLVGYVPQANGFRYENSMGVIAISSIHEVSGEPQYHVSFSHRGQRIDQDWMAPLLKQWGIEDFEEDNHVPNGKVRNFWKPVAGPVIECPCKAVEEPHVEKGGYVWREDREGEFK